MVLVKIKSNLDENGLVSAPAENTRYLKISKVLGYHKLENRGNTTFPRFSICFQRFPAFAILHLSCVNYVSSVKITRKLHANYI